MIKKYLKKPLALIVALMMLLTTIPYNTITTYAEGEETITEINLTFDNENFTLFQVGQTEGAADEQFREELVSVIEDDKAKYYFDKGNSGLRYLHSGGTLWGIGDGTNLISADKEYYLCYSVKPKTGYIFSSNPEEMSFFINEEPVEPWQKKYNATHKSWTIYVPAEDPLPQPEEILIDDVDVTGVTEPKDEVQAIAILPSNDFNQYRVDTDDENNALIWTSNDDTDFAEDETFKQEKTYTVQLTLSAKEGYKFSTNSENPTVYIGTVKVNGKSAEAYIDAEEKLHVTYTFPKLPKTVKDIYLTFEEDNFTEFQVGKNEKDADAQFRTLVGPTATDTNFNYYFDTLNSSLIYFNSGSWYATGESPNLIEKEKEYRLVYTIKPKKGYAFSENIEKMKFYINGEQVIPDDSKIFSSGYCKIYISATPIPKYVVKPQENVNAELYEYNSVRLTWDAQDAEGTVVKYKVEYKESGEDDYTLVAVDTTETSLEVPDLAEETIYKFRVTPYIEEDEEVYEGEAGYSQDVRTLKKLEKPKVKVKLYGHDDIHATWDAQVVEGAEVKYRVEYKRSTWSDYKVLNYGTTRNYRNKANLVNGARYKFKVTPYTEAEGETYWGESGYSRYIYTLKKIAAPRVSKSSRNYVRLRWTNIPGETGYQISRSRYKTKNFKTVKRVSYKYSTTRIKTPRNRTYYYKIRAYKTVDGKRIYAPWSAVRAYRLR